MLDCYMLLNDEAIEKFRLLIWDYYQLKGRFFPWRHVDNPYNVVVSEIMLQQTQTYRVESFYNRFIHNFPDFSSLAKADWSDIIAHWQGLGYNRRGRYLQQLAQIVINKHAGVLPCNIDLLDDLPGIGYATARSIYTFAYNLPTVFIETNIRSVFLHHFFNNELLVSDKLIMPLIAQTLVLDAPRDWYYALMDYGVMIKKEYGNPNKRSKHYKKQSKFQSSDRQIRGYIIKYLVAHKISTIDEFCQLMVTEDRNRVVGIINNLVNEKLISLIDGNLFL